jgi:ABC-type bacteriocin/lantibiotic exporter with double-glycine peptidase domain
LRQLVSLVNPGSPLLVGQREALVVWRRWGSWLLVERASGRTWMRTRRLRDLLAKDAGRAVGPDVTGDQTLVEGTVLRPVAAPVGLVEGHGAGAGHGGHGGHGVPRNARQALAQVWRLLHLDRGDVWVVLVYGISLGMLYLSVPVAVQALVNTVAFGSVLQPLVTLSVLLALALLGAAFVQAMQMRVVEALQRRLVVRVVGDLADRLPRIHPGAFRTDSGPELLNRFFDVFSLQKALALLLLSALDAVLIAFFGLVLLAFYHPALLAFDLLLVIGLALVFGPLGSRGTATSIEESRAKYALAAWLEELSRHRHTWKVGSGARFAKLRAEALTIDYLERREAHFSIAFRQFAGALGLQVLASVALLIIGGYLVIERQLSVGQLVAAELVVTAVVASIAKLGSKVETFYDMLASVDKLGIVLTLPTETDRKEVIAPDAEEPDSGLLPRLLVENLTLRAGRALSFSLRTGDRLAVKGLDDRACEELTEMLFGMRDLAAHRVEVDGHDLRDLSLAALRSRLVVVRDAEVFPGTVADNVRAGRAELGTDEVWDALSAVDLKADVQALPDRVATPLGFLGAPLTRGQALRVTLARALATRPSVLVIDRSLDLLGQEERQRTWQALSRHAPCPILLLTGEPDLMETSTQRLDLSGGQSGEQAA